ncbi:MAG: cupin domain-containing protein [Chloroflexi bacterium]|nr:cupin domain-containing protein [Chloroflexota bacterium]
MLQPKFVFSTQDTVRYRFPTHVNDLVMDRAEADTSEVFVVVLEPGEAPPLHVHHDAEQIFYVIEGTGRLEIGEELKSYGVKSGDVVRIPPHTFHRIHCTSPKALRYLSVDCFVGGKPQAEPTWDSHVREICRINGWEYDKVKRET